MTTRQVTEARAALSAFASSGWAKRMLGPRQQAAISVALWALNMVLQAMTKEAA